MASQQQKTSRAGFTLIELIVVIVIAGILATLGGRFIVAPVTGYIDLARRTRLVDQAEMSLRRMQRDIRHALPNSIWVDDPLSLSLETTIDGGRYRRYPNPDPNTDNKDFLNFAIPDGSFEILGTPNGEVLSRFYDDNDNTMIPGKELDVVVYNTSPKDTGNRCGISALSKIRSYIVTLDSPHQFPHSSPMQRFFILDRNESSVTYSCSGGSLTRNGVLVTHAVDDCEFTYDSGASQRAGLVTLELSLSEEGETITLLHQVHVVNAP